MRLMKEDAIDCSVTFAMEDVPLRAGGLEQYMDHIGGTIACSAGSVEQAIGSLSAVVFRIAEANVDEVCIHDLFDSVDSDVERLYGGIFDPETDCVDDGVLEYLGMIEIVSVIAVMKIGVEEEWRGRGIASAVMFRLGQIFGQPQSVMVLDAFPLQYTFGSFERCSGDDVDARMFGLNEFWAKRGFRMIKEGILVRRSP